MQKVDKSVLLPPGICTLCESAPVEGQGVVDTLKGLVTGFPFKLSGRKYVCDSCIVALGNVVGLVSSDQHDKAAARADKAEAALNAVRDHVANFAKQFEQAALADVVVRAEPEPQDEAPVVSKAAKTKKAADVTAAADAPAE